MRELLRVQIGSRAHGTATEDSDDDQRMVYALPTADILRVVDRGKSVVWEEAKKTGTENDLTGWEIAHYARLALNCNPTILEVLWAPVLAADDYGKELRSIRSCFLSRQRVYDAFRGYASNQLKKMLWEPSAGVWSVRNWKFAEAYLRVLYQGIVLLDTGELPVDLTAKAHSDILGVLKSVRQGKTPKGNVIDMADTLERRISVAWGNCHAIPEKADVELVNGFVVALRRDYWVDEQERKDAVV